MNNLPKFHVPVTVSPFTSSDKAGERLYRCKFGDVTWVASGTALIACGDGENMYVLASHKHFNCFFRHERCTYQELLYRFSSMLGAEGYKASEVIFAEELNHQPKE